LRDLTLIKLNVARFVGRGFFLIRYSNGHMRWTSPTKEVPLLFLNSTSNFKIHYRTVYTDPLVADNMGSADHTLGTTGLAYSLVPTLTTLL